MYICRIDNLCNNIYSSIRDRKSTRLNSSHSQISYAVFCLKKKKHNTSPYHPARRVCDPRPQFTRHPLRCTKSPVLLSSSERRETYCVLVSRDAPQWLSADS